MFTPPRPKSLPAVLALARVMWNGDGDLLSLLPAKAYRVRSGWLGVTRRSMLIVNDPAWVREVLVDAEGIFPKSDLMVGALEPLVGDSIFVSAGARWRRQRALIDPAFSHIRLNRAFKAMKEAVDECETTFSARERAGAWFSLDLAMSQLTADIITRTVFSTSLRSDTAREVFDAFGEFERRVAHVEILRLILDPPFAKVPQPPSVLEACARIRAHLGALIDTHLQEGVDFNDIAAAVINARDADGASGFDREELIDQLGVFFLAGHETTASALTWAVFALASAPDMMARLRAEADAVAEGGPISFNRVKKLVFARAVFREALRLYPPITFLPRVAMQATRIGPHRVKRGALIMIAPWAIHRHHAYWPRPDAFDPDRFMPEREGDIVPGTYLPFGLGPRVCVGAAFAQTESALILARLAQAFDIEAANADRVRPVARLTTRPAEEIMIRLKARRI